MTVAETIGLRDFVAGRLSVMRARQLIGWADATPAWFDGVVLLPGGRAARVRPGRRRVAWILPEADAALMLSLELSPAPVARAIAGEAVHHDKDRSTGNKPVSPAPLQESSPAPNLPPATTPPGPASDARSPASLAGRSSGPALATGGSPCPQNPSSR